MAARQGFWILSYLVSFLLASCGSGQLFAPTVTSTLTVTSTPSVAPSVTLTPTPTSTPTPEIAKPSVPHGLQPENAASQMLENGTWVVKNAFGKTTATWNAETKQWDYIAENIKVEQVFIGNDVDRSILEPYLGPLPPDDPATHFKDANGKPVDYGIGPETGIGLSGGGTYFVTEVFALFLEIPRTPNTATIVVIYGGTDYLSVIATPDDRDGAFWKRRGIIFFHSSIDRLARKGDLRCQEKAKTANGFLAR